MTIGKSVIEAAQAAAAQLDADVFFYNGAIAPLYDLRFIEAVHDGKRRSKALLFLTTNGGDPDSAYKIARYMQGRYEFWSVVISGKCKSAGTLLALGANELVFTPYGELGPLDIQLSKVDRFDQMQAGLTIQDALNTIEQRALDRFFKISTDWIEANQGLLVRISYTIGGCICRSAICADIWPHRPRRGWSTHKVNAHSERLRKASRG